MAKHERTPKRKVYMRAYMRTRQIRKLNATPTWLTQQDQAAIADYYRLADAHSAHVDHIVAIKGKTIEGWPVSGLHVPWNLQILDGRENCRKHNRVKQETLEEFLSRLLRREPLIMTTASASNSFSLLVPRTPWP
jgi:hypothetical protein